MRFPSWLPLLLGFLTAVGPISTDMYLPAFPSIEQSLGGAPGTAQITLATWFAGLAIGQLTQGALSDRFGRRGPLLAGTIIYTIFSVACAVAPSLFWLSVFRFFAAFGGSAAMVIPRAVVRDLADGHAAAKLMSQLMLVMGAAPILAPTLGGFVLGFADWHAIFWFGAVYGAICAITVLWKLPDTLPPQHRVKLGPAALLNRNITIGREHSFLTHALLGSFCLAGVFAYLGGSPTVFIGMLHLSPSHYGMVFGLCAAAYIGMAQVNARILPRFGFSAILHVASAISLLATSTLAVLAFTGPWPAPVFVVPIFINMGCMGCIVPNATVGALSRHSAHAASASALMGTMQFLMGAVSGGLVGIFDNGTAQPMALLMVLGSIGGVIADRLRPREVAEKAIKP